MFYAHICCIAEICQFDTPDAYKYQYLDSSQAQSILSSKKLMFSVKAKHDAHITLEPEDVQDDLVPLYEIVLGAGGNTWSTIRRKHLKEDVASIQNRSELAY